MNKPEIKVVNGYEVKETRCYPEWILRCMDDNDMTPWLDGFRRREYQAGHIECVSYPCPFDCSVKYRDLKEIVELCEMFDIEVEIELRDCIEEGDSVTFHWRKKGDISKVVWRHDSS